MAMESGIKNWQTFWSLALVQREMGDHFPDTVTIIKERLEMSIP